MIYLYLLFGGASIPDPRSAQTEGRPDGIGAELNTCDRNIIMFILGVSVSKSKVNVIRPNFEEKGSYGQLCYSL